MIIAVAIWNQRVAPVFDIAREILLAELSAGRVIARRQEALAGDLPVQKAIRLAELGVGTLICGAISQPVLAMVGGYGIRVVPFVTGTPAEVIQAWCRGALETDLYRMPGCRRRGRRPMREDHFPFKEDDRMTGNNQGGRAGFGGRGKSGGRGQGGGGRGQGGGRGIRGAGQRPGPAAGDAAAQTTGFCVCPQCGRREPHERGTPCVMQQCPQCGGAMTRA